jgi:hypothetical protein
VSTEKRLWEIGHSYYCSTTSYTEGSAGEEYDSWSNFFDEYKDADKDYNLLFRWDWKSPDEDDERPDHVLWLFFMQQRKGRFWPVRVVVTQEDEPAIREYLADHWKHVKALWSPFDIETKNV